jgi:hypothetical protein
VIAQASKSFCQPQYNHLALPYRRARGLVVGGNGVVDVDQDTLKTSVSINAMPQSDCCLPASVLLYAPGKLTSGLGLPLPPFCTLICAQER